LASHLGDFRHAQTLPHCPLCAQLRERIINRIVELKLKDVEAAEQPGLSPGQMSRLKQGEDVFTHRPVDRCRGEHWHRGPHDRGAALWSRLGGRLVAHG
jgi:hypothetical protein